MRTRTFGGAGRNPPFVWRESGSLAFTWLFSRPTSALGTSNGYALAFGEAMAALAPAFLAGGVRHTELRFIPSDALSLEISRYALEGAARLGPVEPGVRVGFTMLHVAYGHGFSFGMFSPRVGAGLWFKFPTVRLGVSGFTEYVWRWFGDDSAFVRGVTFDIEPTVKRRRRR